MAGAPFAFVGTPGEPVSAARHAAAWPRGPDDVSDPRDDAVRIGIEDVLRGVAPVGRFVNSDGLWRVNAMSS